jgi:hypothetical protein
MTANNDDSDFAKSPTWRYYVIFQLNYPYLLDNNRLTDQDEIDCR